MRLAMGLVGTQLSAGAMLRITERARASTLALLTAQVSVRRRAPALGGPPALTRGAPAGSGQPTSNTRGPAGQCEYEQFQGHDQLFSVTSYFFQARPAKSAASKHTFTFRMQASANHIVDQPTTGFLAVIVPHG